MFKFKEKPNDDVIVELKENGFTYRPAEKAWTISAETRILTERLAKILLGHLSARFHDLTAKACVLCRVSDTQEAINPTPHRF